MVENRSSPTKLALFIVLGVVSLFQAALFQKTWREQGRLLFQQPVREYCSQTPHIMGHLFGKQFCLVERTSPDRTIKCTPKNLLNLLNLFFFCILVYHTVWYSGIHHTKSILFLSYKLDRFVEYGVPYSFSHDWNGTVVLYQCHWFNDTVSYNIMSHNLWVFMGPKIIGQKILLHCTVLYLVFCTWY